MASSHAGGSRAKPGEEERAQGKATAAPLSDAANTTRATAAETAGAKAGARAEMGAAAEGPLFDPSGWRVGRRTKERDIQGQFGAPVATAPSLHPRPCGPRPPRKIRCARPAPHHQEEVGGGGSRVETGQKGRATRPATAGRPAISH